MLLPSFSLVSDADRVVGRCVHLTSEMGCLKCGGSPLRVRLVGVAANLCRFALVLRRLTLAGSPGVASARSGARRARLLLLTLVYAVLIMVCAVLTLVCAVWALVVVWWVPFLCLLR